MRIREIVKVGHSYDIRLKPSDLGDMGLKVGDFVDIEEIILTKLKEEKK